MTSLPHSHHKASAVAINIFSRSASVHQLFTTGGKKSGSRAAFPLSTKGFHRVDADWHHADRNPLPLGMGGCQAPVIAGKMELERGRGCVANQNATFKR